MKALLANTHYHRSLLIITKVSLYTFACIVLCCSLPFHIQIAMKQLSLLCLRQGKVQTLYQIKQQQMHSPHIYVFSQKEAIPQNIYLSHLKKARAFSSQITTPIATHLKQQGFVHITVPRSEKNDFLKWMEPMSEHGIHITPDASSHNDSFFIRFDHGTALDAIYTRLLKTIENKTSLSRSLVDHTIRKESGWRENVISPAGAYGLTQTLPIVIEEIIEKKHEAGTSATILNKLNTIDTQIQALQQNNQGGRTLYELEFQKNNLMSLLLIPDYVIRYPYIANTRITLNYGYRRTLTQSRIAHLALAHGPLNTLFGMTYLSLLVNRFVYYKQIGQIDDAVDPLLAAQLAYNCGFSRVIQRIHSLGGWYNIFTIPEKQRSYLPQETANYGYQYIKSQIATNVKENTNQTYAQKQHYYKLCLSALLRSNEYQSLHHSLSNTGFAYINENLHANIMQAIDNASHSSLTQQHLISIVHTLQSLPSWPLVIEVQSYISMLTKIEQPL